MQTYTLNEVRQVLDSEDLERWYQSYREAHEAFSRSRKWSQNDVSYWIFQAGEYDELASRAEQEFARLDTNFESLSQYEITRINATQQWQSVDGAESELAFARQEVNELQTRLIAAKTGKGQAEGEDAPENLKARIRSAEGKVVQHAEVVSQEKTRLQTLEAKRDALWIEVQEAWGLAFQANIAAKEYRFLAKLSRREVERLERNPISLTPSGENDATDEHAESRLLAVLEQGQSKLGAVLVERFLYWPSSHDTTMSWCVPLNDEPSGLNMQLSARSIYLVNRNQGLDFVEPLPPEQIGDDDPRLEAFFGAA